jgi:tetratricopeptide (TPR) repeat protein
MEHPAELVYCLSIDLIGSTQAGLKLTTSRLDQFNIALVEQIKPHLEKLRLTDVLLKFTGDGWLLMTHKAEKVPALCCLATIMAKKFQDEMSQNTGIDIDRIPSLRLAICSGRDLSVELPDRRKDWVGDSARRVTRSSRCCLPNEVIIDEPVRYHVFRDFDVKPVDIEQRSPKNQLKKMEEAFALYTLGELNPEVAVESISPEYFIYTLGKIGKVKEAKAVGQRVAERLTAEAIKLDITDKESLQRNLRHWHRLMASLPDYASTLKILEDMQAARLTPDVITYNILINKAPDYDIAKSWVDTMRTQGMEPNAVTYNTLIEKSPDFNTAKDWMDKMREQGIKPNAVTYNALINKAPDYDIAKDWMNKMREQGIKPDLVTYSILINKAPDYDIAKDWMNKMREQGIKPSVFTYSILINKAPNFDIAKDWMDKMREQGIEPEVVTYCTLFTKNLSEKSADDILKWYLAQEYHPEEAIQAAIATYRKIHRIDDAFRLALDYPHLQVARRLIRHHKKRALSYFRTIYEHDPEQPNSSYALGVALMELGKEEEAQPLLKKALKLARPGPRKVVIREWLRQIDLRLAKARKDRA